MHGSKHERDEPVEKLSGRREMGPKLGLRSRVKLGEAEVRRRASEGTTQSFRAGCRGRGRLDMLITRAVHACQVAQSFLTLCDPMDCSPPGSCPWDSPGKNTGVGCHALLQGIFPTQGSNPHLSPLPAVAGGFFTTSATWEAQSSGLVSGGEPRVILSPVF